MQSIANNTVLLATLPLPYQLSAKPNLSIKKHRHLLQRRCFEQN